MAIKSITNNNTLYAKSPKALLTASLPNNLSFEIVPPAASILSFSEGF